MIAYFDCFSGASGDMILGALVDAGWTGLRDALSSLPVGKWSLETRRVDRRGLSATKVDFVLEHDARERRLEDMLGAVAGSGLDPEVKRSAETIFRRLATVEAGIHGCRPEEVHFHELGGLDTLLDVVGACAGFAWFNFSAIAMSPVALGGGIVRTGHGLLPVPAPATAKLLEGWMVTEGPAQRELTTPTGAAILTHFATAQSMPAMRLSRAGYGAGSRELDHPNVLRLLVGEQARDQPTETVVIVETTIDDMTPELLAVAVEELLAGGALDAYLTPIIAKKGRSAALLTVLSVPGHEQALMELIFRHTSTIGLRYRLEQRRALPRHERTVQTEYGPVRVKIAGEGPLSKAKPELDDCRRLARERGLSAEAVHRAALQALEGAGP